jgi:aldehyde dehydrogenase (NAD+)
MRRLQHYIAGRWAPSVQDGVPFAVVNPATEQVVAELSMAGTPDVDLAVKAARSAFPAYSVLALADRISLLRRVLVVFERRYGEMVEAITTEMGAPHNLSERSQAAAGPGHIKATLDAALALGWEERSGRLANVVREPVGVCALITPWNWPMNQLAAKIIPALVAGCTVVLKPSEQSPLSAQLFAEFIEEAGFPPGVFNMVHGSGPTAGQALCIHPEVDMVSFTGSTRAGISVAKSAADTVKRVTQELGGKSPNIIFADADLETAVKRGVLHCFNNSGQSCNAPTRMLVEDSVYDRVVAIAEKVGRAVKVGDPTQPGDHLGPVVSKIQFDRIQRMINRGIDEGARVIVGGAGKPDGFNVGYYVKPTIFAEVRNQMSIAREEIFGPVLSILRFGTVAEAIEIANDTPYGLAAYIQSGDVVKARAVARLLRAGSVYLNGAGQDYESPFGGFRQSGNGREWGKHGLGEYLELKTINGFYAAPLG